MFIVNKDRSQRECTHCGSDNTCLYGDATRDSSSIKIPTEAELRQKAERDEVQYEMLRDEYRKKDEESIRGDVEDAKQMVKEMEAEGGEALDYIDIWRETAELTEKEIQKRIKERSSQTYWRRFGYKNAEDWVNRSLEVKPNWYAGRHICPHCQTYGLTFRSGIMFD